jgi:hypothetical protein
MIWFLNGKHPMRCDKHWNAYVHFGTHIKGVATEISTFSFRVNIFLILVRPMQTLFDVFILLDVIDRMIWNTNYTVYTIEIKGLQRQENAYFRKHLDPLLVYAVVRVCSALYLGLSTFYGKCFCICSVSFYFHASIKYSFQNYWKTFSRSYNTFQDMLTYMYHPPWTNFDPL